MIDVVSLGYAENWTGWHIPGGKSSPGGVFSPPAGPSWAVSSTKLIYDSILCSSSFLNKAGLI